MPKQNHNALVRQNKNRSVVAVSASPVRLQLAKISSAIPEPLVKASKTSAKICGGTLMAIAAIGFVFILGAYVRLLSGPISFSFLVPSLQDQLNAQSQGYQFRIGDAILRLGNDWGLEFRLANVSLLDEEGQELAKAPFAAIDMSERSLVRFALAPSAINLLEPKLLVFHSGKSLALTPTVDAPPNPENSAFITETKNQVFSSPNNAKFPKLQNTTQNLEKPFNFGPLLSNLFKTVEKRRAVSSALRRIGLTNATIYFVADKGVTTWNIADFHVNFEGRGKRDSVSGEVTLRQGERLWRLAFEAINRPQQKRYSVSASMDDVIPRAIWENVPAATPLKHINLPLTGNVSFDLSHDGTVLDGGAEFSLKAGNFYAPWDEKHPATIDGGVFKVRFDGEKGVVSLDPFEMTWDDSRLRLVGTLTRLPSSNNMSPDWRLELDGKTSRLGAAQFGIAPFDFETLRVTSTYRASTDTLKLDALQVKSGEAKVNIAGEAAALSDGGPVRVNGSFSSMPLTFLKALWPAFVANGARDWIGTNVPTGRINGGELAVDLSAATLADLEKGGDVPENAVSLKLRLSDLQVYSIVGLPPIETRETTARIAGRKFVFDVSSEANVTLPSGKSITFSEGQFLVDDLRPRFPTGEIRFKGGGEAATVMELLDQPPLGYVRAVGFKPDLINGKTNASFAITMPLLKDLKFAQMTLTGKSKVSDLKSNGLPGGLTVTGGAVNFDISSTAIGANGDLKLNGVPVSLVWQRIFDAPPEKQPTLRVAGVLTEKSRDELGMNVNHIVRGDLPIAVALSLQRDGPPKLFAEANLTNSDIYLTAIGWRKPPGQKASLTFDITQPQEGFVALNNFAMTGDGLNIQGHLVMNEKRRIASFNFPEFSTNALTKLEINGELTPQNVLKIQAKGPAFDGRQFFRSLFSAGKVSENQPAPIKDEPGLDLNVEIGTVFGFHDATLKSVTIDGRRRNGKLTGLEIAGRLNGEAPIAVRIEQKAGEPRIMVCEAIDAGSAFRLAGFYRDMRGGQMTLKVNLDGTGVTEKSGMLYVQNFQIYGDEVLGKIVNRAEQENARARPATNGRTASGNEPLVFDRLYVPFAVGANQFTLRDSSINGPVLGATLRGRVDFARDTINLSGTYVPLYGLNSMFGGVPILGDLFNSRQGEGLFGITFAVQGRTSNPDVQVNPVSVLAPGFLRQIFEFDTSAPPPSIPVQAPAVVQQRKQPAPMTRPPSRAASPTTSREN